MKVKLLKDFGEHKKGDTVEVDPERANYWEMVGVAEKSEKGQSKEKKEGSPVASKKEVPQKGRKATKK